MSVELFLETKILSSLYLRVMIQGWGEGTVLHDGNLDEVAIIYLYILKLKHYFFLHSEIHCNLRLHSCWWWRGQLQWRRHYSRCNNYWRGLDGRTCSKVWPVWNVAIKLCGENIIIQGSSSTLPLHKRWLHDYET